MILAWLFQAPGYDFSPPSKWLDGAIEGRSVFVTRVRLNPIAQRRWLACTDPDETMRLGKIYGAAYGWTAKSAVRNLQKKVSFITYLEKRRDEELNAWKSTR